MRGLLGKGIDVVAVNDLWNTTTLAHLLARCLQAASGLFVATAADLASGEVKNFVNHRPMRQRSGC